MYGEMERFDSMLTWSTSQH